MLTSQDIKLLEKSTRKIVREEVETEGKTIRDDLRSEILGTKMELSNNISSLGSRLKNLEIATDNLQKDVTTVKKDVKKLKKDVGGVINMADKGLIAVQKRLKVTEKQLGLPEVDFV